MYRILLVILTALLLVGGCDTTTKVFHAQQNIESDEIEDSGDPTGDSGDNSSDPETEQPEGGGSIENPGSPGPEVSATTGPKNPLLDYQWYIYNDLSTKSNVFTNSSEGNSGNHINVLEAHELATGAGIIVNVVDSDLELGHEDLRTSQAGSYDYLENDTNPQPTGSGGSHGTSVAGIIGMKKDNHLGGVGVAPGVTLIGHAYIGRTTVNATIVAKAYGVPYDASGEHVASEIAHVFNNSNGLETAQFQDSGNSWIQTRWQTLDAGVRLGRQGKGYIYVQSSGKGFVEDSMHISGNQNLHECSTKPLGCTNSSADYQRAHPAVIVVAATNARRKRASYSTIGSSLWVAAPGGEYGYDKNNSEGEEKINGYHPAVLTTDYQGCDKGYSKATGTARNLFEYNLMQPHHLNPACSYTSVFDGASAAAPMVSGVAALMLEVNPNLTWLDVKHILATTATQLDLSNIDEETDGVMVKNGWTTNGAGYKFHSWYGFGQVEAYEAVKAAQTYTANSLGTFRRADVSADGLNNVIPDYDSSTDTPGHIGVTANISDVLTVMSARLTLSLCKDGSNDMAMSDYTIHLTSPTGTTSVLKSAFDLTPNADHSQCGLYNAAILSNAFYGESGNGAWGINVYDQSSGKVAKLTDYTLTVFGY